MLIKMDWLEIVIVALSSIFTGVIVWYFTSLLSEKRLNLKVNPLELSGHWEGIHLSRDNSRGGTIPSRHHYDLSVNRSGKIKGTYTELSGNPPYQLDVEGVVGRGEIFLIGKNPTTQEPSYTWLFNLYNLDKIPGFHFTYDFDGRPYATFIVLSRKEVDEKEYLALLEKDSERFYIYSVKKSK